MRSPGFLFWRTRTWADSGYLQRRLRYLQSVIGFPQSEFPLPLTLRIRSFLFTYAPRYTNTRFCDGCYTGLSHLPDILAFARGLTLPKTPGKSAHAFGAFSR
jgi:hypothetical protein